MVSAILVALVMLGFVPAVFAQGCVICKTTAAAGGEGAAKAMNLAILVLLIPTLSIFVGILLWAFRYRNRSLDEQTPRSDVAPDAFFPGMHDSSFFGRRRPH